MNEGTVVVPPLDIAQEVVHSLGRGDVVEGDDDGPLVGVKPGALGAGRVTEKPGQTQVSAHPEALLGQGEGGIGDLRAGGLGQHAEETDLFETPGARLAFEVHPHIKAVDPGIGSRARNLTRSGV